MFEQLTLDFGSPPPPAAVSTEPTTRPAAPQQQQQQQDPDLPIDPVTTPAEEESPDSLTPKVSINLADELPPAPPRPPDPVYPTVNADEIFAAWTASETTSIVMDATTAACGGSPDQQSNLLKYASFLVGQRQAHAGRGANHDKLLALNSDWWSVRRLYYSNTDDIASITKSVLYGIERFGERFLDEGTANVLLAKCPSAAIPSLIPKAIRDKMRLTVHTHDPIVRDILKAEVPNARILFSSIDEPLRLPAGRYDLVGVLPDGMSPVNLRSDSEGPAQNAAIAASLAPKGVMVGVFRADNISITRGLYLETKIIHHKRAFHERLDHKSAISISRVVPPGGSHYVFLVSEQIERDDDQVPPGLKPSAYSEPTEVTDVDMSVAQAFASVDGRSYSGIGRAVETSDDVNVGIGRIMVKDGEVYINSDGSPAKMAFKTSLMKRRVLSLCGLHEIYTEYRKARHNAPADIGDVLRKLEDEYDRHVSEFGPISAAGAAELIDEMPELSPLTALEVISETGTIEKGGIFNPSKTSPVRTVEIRTPRDAALFDMRTYGDLDLSRVADLLGGSVEQVEEALKDDVFWNPETRKYEMAETYLSGDVMRKITMASNALTDDPRMQRNIEKLQKIVPNKVPADNLALSPAAPWMPEEVVQDFARHVFGIGAVNVTRKENQWYVEARANTSIPERLDKRYSVRSRDKVIRSSVDIFRALLKSNGVMSVTVEGADGTSYIDENLTVAAVEKAKYMREDFEQWVLQSEKQKERVETAYADKVNRFVVPEVPKDLVSFEGLDPSIEPFPHQVDAVAFGLVRNSVCLNHPTGSGKTFTYVALANERLHSGSNRKIAMVVPKSVFLQTVSESNKFFPDLDIVPMGPAALRAQGSGNMARRISNMEKGLFLMTHETFAKLPVDVPEKGIRIQRDRLRALRSELLTAPTQKAKSRIEAQIRKVEANVKKDSANAKRVVGATWKELGLDGVIVDEVQYYRNTATTSGKSNSKAEDLSLKLKALREVHPNCFVAIGTGTLLNRSITELYTYQSYLQPEVMTGMGIHSRKDWLNQFTRPLPAPYRKISGDVEMRPNPMITNVPELRTLFGQVCHTVRDEDLGYLNKPAIRGGQPEVVSCEKSYAQEVQTDQILRRIDDVQYGVNVPGSGPVSVDPKVDNTLKIYTDAVRSAIHPRLMDPDVVSPSNGKLDMASRDIGNLYRETNDRRGTMLVFSDIFGSYRTNDVGRKDLVFDMREELINLLVSREGIPRNEIGCITSGTSDKQKVRMFDKFTEGDMRILIGGTDSLGVGLNLQKHICGIFELDIPWNPSSMKQRRARGLRPGTIFDEIVVKTYITRKSGEGCVVNDCARKNASFDAFWRAAATDREIPDIDSFNENINALQSELLDPRVARLTMLNNDMMVLKNRILHLTEFTSPSEWQLKAEERDKALAKGAAERSRFFADHFDDYLTKRSMDPSITPAYSVFETKDGKKPSSHEQFVDIIKQASRHAELSSRRDSTVEVGTMLGLRLAVRKMRHEGLYFDRAYLVLGEGSTQENIPYGFSEDGAVRKMWTWLKSGARQESQEHLDSVSRINSLQEERRKAANSIDGLRQTFHEMNEEHVHLTDELQGMVSMGNQTREQREAGRAPARMQALREAQEREEKLKLAPSKANDSVNIEASRAPATSGIAAIPAQRDGVQG